MVSLLYEQAVPPNMPDVVAAIGAAALARPPSALAPAGLCPSGQLGKQLGDCAVIAVAAQRAAAAGRFTASLG